MGAVTLAGESFLSSTSTNLFNIHTCRHSKYINEKNSPAPSLWSVGRQSKQELQYREINVLPGEVPGTLGEWGSLPARGLGVCMQRGFSKGAPLGAQSQGSWGDCGEGKPGLHWGRGGAECDKGPGEICCRKGTVSRRGRA